MFWCFSLVFVVESVEEVGHVNQTRGERDLSAIRVIVEEGEDDGKA